MGLKGMLIGIMIVGVLITGLSISSISLGEEYDNPLNETFQNNFAEINQSISDIEGIIANSSGKVETSEGVITETDSLRLDKLVVQFLKLPLNAVKTVGTMITAINRELHLPAWFVNAWYFIIFITFLYLVVAAFRGLSRTP